MIFCATRACDLAGYCSTLPDLPSQSVVLLERVGDNKPVYPGFPGGPTRENGWGVSLRDRAVGCAESPAGLLPAGLPSLTQRNGAHIGRDDAKRASANKSESQAGSAVTGWKSRERLAAPVAETRDVTFSHSRSCR